MKMTLVLIEHKVCAVDCCADLQSTDHGVELFWPLYSYPLCGRTVRSAFRTSTRSPCPSSTFRRGLGAFAMKGGSHQPDDNNDAV